MLRYIPLTKPAYSKGLTADVYAQIKDEFLRVPPLTLHAGSPTLFAAVWSMIRETLLVDTSTRARKRAVAAAIAKLNQCPPSSEILVPEQRALTASRIASLISRSQPGETPDPILTRVVLWTLATAYPKSEAVQKTPVPPSVAPEIIGTIVAFHYLMRMINIFVDHPKDSDDTRGEKAVFPPTQMEGWILGDLALPSTAAGTSLALLPKAPLPHDMTWAQRNPVIAGAFARLAAEIEHLADSVLDEEVRGLVLRYISTWPGGPLRLQWQEVEARISILAGSPKATARLALLSALSPDMVDLRVIQEFRKHHRDDTDVLAVTSWASLTMARKIGSWIFQPSRNEVQT